jgi:hypothetical protein
VTSPVLKFEAIAEACRPMAAILLDRASDREPCASELAAARIQLACARRAPGRLGWAVRIIIEGKTSGSRMEQAIDIIVRAAGHAPRVEAKPDVHEPDAYRDVLHLLRRPLSQRVVEFRTLTLDMPTAQSG